MHKEPPSPRDAVRGWPWDRPAVSYLSSGTLELSLTSSRLEGMRRNWSDGKRQRLEDVLGEFVVGLDLAASRLRELHAEDVRRQQAQLEAELRRAEEAERRRLEEARIARLIGEAAA
jgi:sigma54-dependent transcription regulator